MKKTVIIILALLPIFLIFTISFAARVVSITATLNKTEVVKGQTAIVSTSLAPSNTTNYNPTYVFTEGEEYCIRTDNVLTIKETAPTDAIIKFKIVSGTTESNELSIKVIETQEEINEQAILYL